MTRIFVTCVRGTFCHNVRNHLNRFTYTCVYNMATQYTIANILEDANKLREDLKNTNSKLNPHHQLTLLLGSHSYNDHTVDASEFFYHIINDADEFFSKDNMPASWSLRSCSSAMESLKHLVEYETVRTQLLKDMNADDMATLINILDEKRKVYMNEAKKDGRKKKKVQKHVIDIYNDEDSSDEQSSDAVPSKGNLDNDNSTHQHTPKHMHLQKALWILDRYIESEHDDFKKIILDMIKEHMQKELEI